LSLVLCDMLEREHSQRGGVCDGIHRHIRSLLRAVAPVYIPLLVSSHHRMFIDLFLRVD
jgi:hypothetical protein